MLDDLADADSDQTPALLTFTERVLCRPWWRYAGICLLLIVVLGALDGVGSTLFGTVSDGPGVIGGICVLLMAVFLCVGLYVRLRKAHLVPRISSEIGGFTKKLCIGLLSIKLLSVIGCFGGSSGMQSHTVGDQFSIRLPAAFLESGVPVSNGLAMSDAANDLHVSVAIVPKVDLTARTVEEAAALGVRDQRSGLTDVTAGSPEVMTREGRLQVNTVLRGAAEGTNLVFVMRHIDFGNEWVEVNMWTTTSRYDDYRDMFRVIANSVKRTGEQ